MLPPDSRAPHAEWLSYAVSQGMPISEARRRSRDELRACFRPPGAPLGAEPDLERFDRDPEAVAARREARS